jgi:hypothetical protein
MIKEGVNKMKLRKVYPAIFVLGVFCTAMAGEAVTPVLSSDSAKVPAISPIVNPDSQAKTREATRPINPPEELLPIVPPSKARIKFDEADYNFGSIQKGSQVTHNFWFTNEGTDTLIITKVQPTCGCTTTRNKGISVSPKGRSSVDISFNSGRFNGKVTKGVKVECNDSVNPYLELRFTATINDPLQIIESSPLEVNFKTLPLGAKANMAISLTNLDSTLSKLIIVEQPSQEFIKVKINKMKLKPKESTKLDLTLSDKISEGPWASSITIEVENKPDSRITIPVLGTISATPEKPVTSPKK